MNWLIYLNKIVAPIEKKGVKFDVYAGADASFDQEKVPTRAPVGLFC